MKPVLHYHNPLSWESGCKGQEPLKSHASSRTFRWHKQNKTKNKIVLKGSQFVQSSTATNTSQLLVRQKTVPPSAMDSVLIYPVRYSRQAIAWQVGNLTPAPKIERMGPILFSPVPEQFQRPFISRCLNLCKHTVVHEGFSSFFFSIPSSLPKVNKFQLQAPSLRGALLHKTEWAGG